MTSSTWEAWGAPGVDMGLANLPRTQQS